MRRLFGNWLGDSHVAAFSQHSRQGPATPRSSRYADLDSRVAIRPDKA